MQPADQQLRDRNEHLHYPNQQFQPGVSQGFLTELSLEWANRLQDTNSLRNNFDPSLRSNVTLRIRQRLLQGFGRTVNGRNIRISKNNREVSDLVFEQQVAETVSGVQNLYWDLVSFAAELRGREEDLRLAQRLYADNKRRVEIGTLAPIEIVRAEAEVAARQQDVELALTRLQLQGTLLKTPSALTVWSARRCCWWKSFRPTESRCRRSKHPTDSRLDDFGAGGASGNGPIPHSAQNRDLTVKGIRHAMLPQVDLVADVTNNGLAGRLNESFQGFPGFDNPCRPSSWAGWERAWANCSDVISPDYSIGVQVTIPLKNRRAQADMTATMLERRQAEIRLRQQENAVRAEVSNAMIGVRQARARNRAAQKARVLQEQTLHAEQRKFDLGVSTIFLVVQAQRDLALSRSTEITTRNNYVKSRVELARSTGQSLRENNISVHEAYEGRVSKPADPIPPPSPAEDDGAAGEAAYYFKPFNGVPLVSFEAVGEAVGVKPPGVPAVDISLPLLDQRSEFSIEQDMAPLIRASADRGAKSPSSD